MANKKRRISTPNWSGLDTNLLELVIKKLSFLDILRLGAVCCYWNSAAKSHVFSPLLMIPSNQTENKNNTKHSKNTLSTQFFSLADNKVYSFENFFEELDNCWCVGSSHGWLVFLDKKSNPLVFNPFSGETITLPLITSLPSYRKSIREICISKAILILSDSSVNNIKNNEKKKKKKTSVVVIYGGSGEKLSYCNVGDKSWTELNGENSPYSDIICHDDRLYALSFSNCVEVWDFKSDSFLIKVMNFVPSEVLVTSLSGGNYSKDKYFGKRYLVESMGEILLVTRFIGYFVNAYGELLDEADLLTDEDTHPLVCPYRTFEFCVHKMDLRGRKWEKMVQGLGDHRALLVGGNESESVSTQDSAGFEGNSIYFTDDNWEDMSADYLYGGHDMGVYNLERKVVEDCYDFDEDKVFPPPFWIIPTP